MEFIPSGIAKASVLLARDTHTQYTNQGRDRRGRAGTWRMAPPRVRRANAHQTASNRHFEVTPPGCTCEGGSGTCHLNRGEGCTRTGYL